MRKQCVVCKCEFEVSNYDAKRGRGKFCSRKCSNALKEKVNAVLGQCGTNAEVNAEVNAVITVESPLIKWATPEDISLLQEQVDKVYPWRGKQALVDKWTRSCGVVELQVTTYGKVVCFPTCRGKDLSPANICGICGRDMSKYFGAQEYAPHKEREKEYSIYKPKGHLESETAFNEIYKDGEKKWVLNTKEVHDGKIELLRNLMEKENKKYMGQMARERKSKYSEVDNE